MRHAIVAAIVSAVVLGRPFPPSLKLWRTAEALAEAGQGRQPGVQVITGKDLVAIPYFAWNNRGKGEMAVWVPYR